MEAAAVDRAGKMKKQLVKSESVTDIAACILNVMLMIQNQVLTISSTRTLMW